MKTEKETTRSKSVRIFDKKSNSVSDFLKNSTMMNTKTDTQGSSSPLSNMNELLDEWLQSQSNADMKLESDDVFYNVSEDCFVQRHCMYLMRLLYNSKAVGRRCNFSASKRVALLLSKRRKIYSRLKNLDWQSLSILILYLHNKKTRTI